MSIQSVQVELRYNCHHRQDAIFLFLGWWRQLYEWKKQQMDPNSEIIQDFDIFRKRLNRVGLPMCLLPALYQDTTIGRYCTIHYSLMDSPTDGLDISVLHSTYSNSQLLALLNLSHASNCMVNLVHICKER